MMVDSVRLLRPDMLEWDDWIGRGQSDFYHTAAYHRLFENSGDCRAWMAVFGNTRRFLAWPYLSRPIEGTALLDGTSVYGYAGPVASGCADDAAFRADAWRAVLETWRAQGLISMFTNFHPLFDNATLCRDFRASPDSRDEGLLTLGRSVSIDLSTSAECRFQNYKRRFRQDLRRSAKAGLKVSLDKDWMHFRNFVRLYHDTMEYNHADERYRFSTAYLLELRSVLGPKCHLAIARLDQQIAAALLFVIHGEIAQAHLTGIDGQRGARAAGR